MPNIALRAGRNFFYDYDSQNTWQNND